MKIGVPTSRILIGLLIHGAFSSPSSSSSSSSVSPAFPTRSHSTLHSADEPRHLQSDSQWFLGLRTWTGQRGCEVSTSAGGIISLRGGMPSVNAEELVEKSRKIQSLKDKLLQAVEKGDKKLAKSLMKSLKEEKERAQAKLARAQNERDPGKREKDLPILQNAPNFTFLEWVKVREEEKERRLNAREEALNQEAYARCAALSPALMDPRRKYADKHVHGLEKCEDEHCVQCRSDPCEMVEVDHELEEDGLHSKLALPHIFLYQKRDEGRNETEIAMHTLPSDKIPIVNGEYGRLVRLNASHYLLCESQEELQRLRDAKGYGEEEWEKVLEDGTLKYGMTDTEYENVEHINEDLKRQIAEDMVWDNEARSLNEAQVILEHRAQAKDRYYSIRAPAPTPWYNYDPSQPHTDAPEEEADDNVRLCIAAGEGNLTAATQLLDRGEADVNYQLGAYRNMTPMHCAAWGGWPDMVSLLASRGGSVNAASEVGQTPLHKAAQHGGDRMVEIPQHFVEALKPTTHLGRTPYTYTHVPYKGANWSEVGSLAVTRRLISLGADVWAKDTAGETAEEKAADYGRMETMDLLRRVMGLDLDGNAPHEYRDGQPPPSRWLSYIDPKVFEARKQWDLAEKARIRAEEDKKAEEAQELRRQGFLGAGVPQSFWENLDWQEMHEGALQEMDRMVKHGEVTVDEDGRVLSGLPENVLGQEVAFIKEMAERYARIATPRELEEAEAEAQKVLQMLLGGDQVQIEAPDVAKWMPTPPSDQPPANQ